MQPRPLATMVTTTWLPGDLRGYVDDGIILPSDPVRLEGATKRMGDRQAIRFSADQQRQLFKSQCAAADEFGYRLTDASIESWRRH